MDAGPCLEQSSTDQMEDEEVVHRSRRARRGKGEGEVYRTEGVMMVRGKKR